MSEVTVDQPLLSSSTEVEGNDFLSSVPEQYQNESFVHDIMRTENPNTDMWTKFAGMHEALKVQPAGMPSATDSDEVWEKWSSAVALENISSYGDIKPVLDESQEHLKELLDPAYAPEVTSHFLEGARKLGVSPYQMKGLMNIFNEIQVTAAEEYYNTQQQGEETQNKEFDTFCEQQFGGDREKIIGEGFKFITANVPPQLVPYVNELSNEALATVAALAYNLKQKYGMEDTMPGQKQIYTGAGADIPSLKAEIGEKMNSEPYQNAFDPRHQQMVNEVHQLSTQLARLTQPRKGY